MGWGLDLGGNQSPWAGDHTGSKREQREAVSAAAEAATVAAGGEGRAEQANPRW